MTQCIKCKSSMTPRQQHIGLNFICTNPKQEKGLVKANFKCEYGEK